MDSYLERLTARLADGLQAQPAPFRRRHATYIRACQNADGGFGGRDAASDLYYTGFALRGLTLLGELTPVVAERTASYLSQRLTGSASVVDFFSLLYAATLVQAAAGIDVLADAAGDWPERVAGLLGSYRTPDGGFGKTPDANSGSTYHTFLVALCFQLLYRPLPDAAGLAAFIRSRMREDGGFVEIAPMRRSGTNPTAAAIGVLKILDALDEETKRKVVDFLAGLRSMDGGLQANSRVPLADLLSTFTGCWTLAELDAMTQLDRTETLAYVKSLERPEGGFHGGAWDAGFDVEYTFYGLGAVALLDVRSDPL